MNIVLFGYGKLGKYIVQNRPYCGKGEIYVLDNNSEKVKMECNGIHILSPIDIQEKEREKLQVIITVYEYKMTLKIIQELFAIGYKTFYILQQMVLNQQQSIWNMDGTIDFQKVVRVRLNEQKTELLPVLKYLETHIANGCNLKCKGCTHFSNLYSPKDMVDLEYFNEQIKIINTKCTVLKLRLLGGEPLLNPKVEKYLESARKTFPSTEIQLVTNGLLLDKKEDYFFELLKNLKILISISWYPPTIKKRNLLLRKLLEYGVDYVECSENIDKFSKCLTLQRNHDGRLAEQKCNMARCTILKDSKLYKCPLMAYSYKLNEKFGTNLLQDFGFDIESPGEGWREFIDNLENPTLFCSYCAENPVTYSWRGGRIPSLEDWIV